MKGLVLTGVRAAKNGHLECLKYAHENGCPWDGETCSEAAENGHLECLKYARENGCPGSESSRATSSYIFTSFITRATS